MKHIILIVLTVGIINIGIFLPYIPGDYDFLAAVLSRIFQLASFASLLLVPVGLIWIFIELIKNKRFDETIGHRRFLKKVALGITIIIILAAALGAFASNSRFTAIFILMTGAYVILSIHKKFMEVNSGGSIRPSAAAYYFIIIPLSVLVIRIMFLEKIKSHSTDFVINQSEQLIQDIEAFKIANGHYPKSLQSTIEDYKPSVSGIRRFHYEPNGNAYNLYFEQFSDKLGTEEIVMFNKLDEHEMTVHNQDLLRIPPQNIRRGYHAVARLSTPHWKVFYFD